ncbi:hypothetical protein AVEN_107249-1 [Araneus ventricosus]|uniref:Uncharacterized protein n=1 Tax=Araneus ventricosus TaxID=182803 RepID=A0A4Y2HK70_ARAVE|nr:hypothetical protein AVEN_107249-1 [Araneus ventricosus]
MEQGPIFQVFWTMSHLHLKCPTNTVGLCSTHSILHPVHNRPQGVFHSNNISVSKYLGVKDETNFASSLLPLDMGKIKFFKGCYKRRLVDSNLIKIENKVEKPFKVLEEYSGKMSGIKVEEYLTADADIGVFAGVTEENILSEITDEMENDEDDTDPSQSLLTFQEDFQSV